MNTDEKYELRNGTSIKHEMASALKIADVAVLFWNTGVPYLGSSIEYLNQWDGKRYIICPPNEVPRLVCALGIVPTPATDEGILVVDNSQIDAVCGYLSSCEMLWDYYNQKVLIDSDDHKKYHVRGADVPDDVRCFLLGRKAQQTASRIYGNPHFVHADLLHVNHARAQAIFESLLMGIENKRIPAFPLEPRLPQWQARCLNTHLAHEHKTFIPYPKDTSKKEAYNFYRNIARLWACALRHTHLAAVFQGVDEDEKEMRSAIKELGHTIGMESYIETYLAGVPVEDIIA